MTRSSRPVIRCFARAGSVAAIAMAVAPFAAAQTILWSASGDKNGDELGYDLTTVADVNGDGIVDVAAAAKTKDSTGKIIGTVRFLDGASGAKLFDYVGASTLPVYHVSDMHDVDGDGVEDFLSTSTGIRVEVWSGRTLKMLYKVADDGDPDLDPALAVGDVDLDGVQDFALGPYFSSGVRIYSGKKGTKLYTIHPPSGSSTAWGSVLKALGDVNGDGWPDLLITDGLESSSLFYGGAAYVHSLKDGTQLTKLQGAGVWDQFGMTAGAAGDFDQDGVTDFAISAPNESAGSNRAAGVVHIYSGASFSEITKIQGRRGFEYLEVDDIAGDFDGDGVPDLAMMPEYNPGVGTFMRWIHSGRTTGRLYGMQSPMTGYALNPSKVFPGVDLDGDGFDELLISSSDGSTGKLPGTVEARRGAPSFLTAYPSSRPSPLTHWSYNNGATDEATFFFHLAGFQPGSLISLTLVEVDGAATTTLLFAGNANAMGEQDYAAVFIPPRSGQYVYKVQASGTDTAGASVSTTVEPFEYD